MKILLRSFAWIALGLCFSCGGGGGGKGTSTLNTPWVGATLTGSDACKGGTAILTKEVPLTVGTPSPSLTVGAARIAHASETANTYFYGAIPVTNTGTVTRCFVKASGIAYKDAAGNTLLGDGLSYVYGRVHVLSTVSTWSCLDPGETAYFTIIESLSYTSIAAIHIGTLADSPAGTPALARLVPTGYTASAGKSSITIVNKGTGSAKIQSIPAYAQNSQGEFLFWGFASGPTSDAWTPGETRTATLSLNYEGSCPRLLVIPTFNAVEVSSATTTHAPSVEEETPTTPEQMQAFVHARNLREQAKAIQEFGAAD